MELAQDWVWWWTSVLMVLNLFSAAKIGVL